MVVSLDVIILFFLFIKIANFGHRSFQFLNPKKNKICGKMVVENFLPVKQVVLNQTVRNSEMRYRVLLF